MKGLNEEGKVRRLRIKWGSNSAHQKYYNEYKYRYIEYFVTNWAEIGESLYTFWPILRLTRYTTCGTFPDFMYEILSFGGKYQRSRVFEWFDAGAASNYGINILLANLYIVIKTTSTNRRCNTLHGRILSDN